MIQKRSVLLFVLLTAINFNIWASSPPNLFNNIIWDIGASRVTVESTEAAFNKARRQEEIQLGLPQGKLVNLKLPEQAIWNKMTDDAKALLLINSERIARDEMLPGVIGLPLEGIETHIDHIAKKYGDLLHDLNAFSHSADGLSPFLRIDNDLDIGTGTGCHDFLPRAESLAAFASRGFTISEPLIQAVYGFLYADAESHWGHREMILLQDTDLRGRKGFINDDDDPKAEGYLGVYVRMSDNYHPDFAPDYEHGAIVVLEYFDPIENDPFDGAIQAGNSTRDLAPCSYDPQLQWTEVLLLPTPAENSMVPTINIPSSKWMQISMAKEPGTSPSESGNSVGNIFGDDLPKEQYGPDKQWMIFHHDASNNSYKLLNLEDALEPGQGYWIVQNTGSNVIADSPGSASPSHVTYSVECISNRGCFKQPLATTPNGITWQMIGNPMHRSVRVDDIRVITDAGACSSGCNLTKAASEKIVESVFWHFDPNSNQYIGLRPGQNNEIKPWDGFWAQTLGNAAGLNPRLLFPSLP